MGIEKLEDHRLAIKYDGSLTVATGRNRWDTHWKNKSLHWSALLKKLQEPTRTQETMAEYRAMSKADQDQIKDVGGFVGGGLKGGHRKADTVEGRQIVSLDADYAPAGLQEDLEFYIDGAYAVYSTHKHCPEKPRLRILIPLDRMVTPDEYEAISRKLADKIGIEYFDDTTYQPSRMMFWGSVSRDGEYVFDYSDAPWIRADDVLAEYPDWTDTSYWPESSRVPEIRKRAAKKQGDPCEKKGLIGAFCRTYTIDEAIRVYLSDVYIPCDKPGRYTYAEGSTAAGLVLYDDKFAYSNHATDPASGKLCNAFDLVRIHKFGAQDEDSKADTPTTKLPSYKAMIEFVRNDRGTKLTLTAERKQEAREDFSDEDWAADLEYGKDTKPKNSLKNARLILQHDPALQGIVFNQLADNIEIKGDVPWKSAGGFWRDADDAQLENYLDANYTEFTKVKILSAITKVSDDRSYHPIREYLDVLPEWDGVKRVDTLLIDYLGAEDTEYVRQVTRKTLCAAVNRVKDPGCKFDTMLVLCGPQGIGKSTLIQKLGGKWFTDSLSIADMKDKTAAEKLQGFWLIEVGELAGMRKTDVETVKAFLSRQTDDYRASYGRRVGSHPRQCVIIGTTNAEEGFLRDTTGGRRFWPVRVPRIGEKRVWDMTETEVQQIWAEVLTLYETEELFLKGDAADAAEEAQREALESDDLQGVIEEYLNKKLPENWESWSLYKRQQYYRGETELEDEVLIPEGTVERKEVCIRAILCECLQHDLAFKDRRLSNELAAIMARIPGWEKEEKTKRVLLYGPQRIYRKNCK